MCTAYVCICVRLIWTSMCTAYVCICVRLSWVELHHQNPSSSSPFLHDPFGLEKPVAVLLNEFGPAEVGVFLFGKRSCR